MTTRLDETSTAHLERTGPGWPEVLAGGAAYGALIILVVVLLPLIEDPGLTGVIGLFVSGVMGMVAIAVAARLRIRRLYAFGFKRARAHHLLVGALLGIVAYVLGTVAAIAFMVITGDTRNVQTSYQAAAAGGWWSLAVTLVAGAVMTPLGEEGFFRGVLANALLSRYPSWVGVIGSATVFAVAHGINPIMSVAFVVGVLTALLFKWSGSIWPGVVLHGVNNAIALLVPLLIGLAGG